MQYEIVKFDGLPYVYDESTGYMVFTTVTIEGVTHEMWLPVMDGSNKAMKATPYTYTTKKFGEKTVDAATMFDINRAIMRCLTKNLAMFGIGLYIYADEDLPEAEKERLTKKAKEEQAKAEAARQKAAEIEAEIKPIRDEITEVAKEKIASGIDKNVIYQILSENNKGQKNPNAIKDVDLAKKILEIIKNMEVA